jgi:hypothetical protein
MPHLHRELLFTSSSRFTTLPNLFNYNIFYEFILNKFVAELTRVIYGRNQQVESFGAVDSSRVIFRIRVETSRRKLRLDRVRVNDSTRYNTV